MNLAAILALWLVILPAQEGTSAQPQSSAPQSQQSGNATSKSFQQSAKPPGPKSNTVHPRKTIYPNCFASPSSANSVGSVGQKKAPDGTATPSASKPCPPPKKVVRNGSSEEPKVELLGGTPAQKASTERSTEEITAATEENLKKIAGLELSSNQQETVTQVRQFIEQSKKAVASGDPERGRNLALKARLLSDELVKP